VAPPGPFSLRPIFITGTNLVIKPADPIDAVFTTSTNALIRVTLPSAVAAKLGRVYAIRCLVGGTLVVAAQGNVVEGQALIEISEGEAELLMSDGGERWISIADRRPPPVNPTTNALPDAVRDVIRGGGNVRGGVPIP
jgi:hypothetical protein